MIPSPKWYRPRSPRIPTNPNTQQPLYYDTHKLPGLLSEVYAPSLEIDYTSILGGTPLTVTRTAWVDEVGTLLSNFASTQHVTS
jgi:hypothetical protein